MTPDYYENLTVLQIKRLLRGKMIKVVYVYFRLTPDYKAGIRISKAKAYRIVEPFDNDKLLAVWHKSGRMYFG